MGKTDTKKSPKVQKYWGITLAYTDVNKTKFRDTLRIIVDFIDNHPQLKENYDKKLYSKLQPELRGYREEAKKLLRASSNETV